MSKMPTDLIRHTLNGPAMGARWSAQFHAPKATDPAPIRAALVESVDVVDRQMSTWKCDSDLMRLNRAPAGEWVRVPAELMEVLIRGIEIGRLSKSRTLRRYAPLWASRARRCMTLWSSNVMREGSANSHRSLWTCLALPRATRWTG